MQRTNNPSQRRPHSRPLAGQAASQLSRLATMALALSTAALSGCAMSTDNQSTFDVHGPLAEMQLSVFYRCVWVCVAIFAVVGSALAFTILRYRVSEEPKATDPLPPQTHGNMAVELAQTIVSVLLLVLIAVPTVKGIQMMNDIDSKAAAEDSVTIDVVGKQWWWVFKYPDSKVTTANEIVIPVGKPVVLNLKSDDVIHSFWVPKIAGKTDVIPGQHNRMWLQADSTGLYYGQCAEYCGDSHANMRFRVRVLYESEYKAWLAGQRKAPSAPTSETAMKGYDIFMKGSKQGKNPAKSPMACSACHNINGTPAKGAVGPDLSHFAARSTMAAGLLPRNDTNIKLWLKHLEVVKPGNKMLAANLNLSDEEVDALTAYLDTLY